MDKSIENLKPQGVWKIFKDICSIPHPSKHEEKIREYVVDFAKKNNIEYEVDKIGNVIMRKPATPGYENRKGLILQAHLDMVPQKNGDKNFDFLKDGIEAYVDGDWVTADGTTLGADNGMGVASILYIMENNDLKHGPLEALLTIDEETGMTGANHLAPDTLKGDILLNLDSEDEGEMYVGCAGGVDLAAKIKYTLEDAPSGYGAYRISISGLKGGHSGMEINLQRGNSNKIMGRLLNSVNEHYDMRLVKAAGGNMRNAIPREAEAEILISEKDANKALAKLQDTITDIRNELREVENSIIIEVTPVEMPAKIVDRKAQNILIESILAVANGVNRMSDDMPGLVESSSNMGIVAMKDGFFELYFLIRGSVDSGKDLLAERIAAVFKLSDSETKLSGGYPGWQPNLDSPILKRIQEIYNKLFGRIPEIKGVHAGLECGIIGGIYPNLDMISFGPTIRFPHSPDEKVNIESVEKFVKLLEAVVQDAPVK